MSDKQVNIWMRAVMVYIQVMLQHLSRKVEANNENRWSEDSL
jgi:hypothetical protein